MEARFRSRELIEVTNKGDGAATAIVAAVLQEALDDASTLIDGYLDKAGYTTPLSTAPAFIVRANADIARWFLHTRAGVEVKDTEPRLRYEDAIALLESIAEGKLTVPGATLVEDFYAGVAAGKRTLVFGDDFVEQFDIGGAA